MKQLKFDEVTINYKIYMDKLVYIMSIDMPRYTVEKFETAISKISEKYPKKSLIFSPFHKNQEEYNVIIKVFKKLKWKLVGKKIVYNKFLRKQDYGFKLTFKTLKQVKSQTLFRELYVKSFGKSKLLSDLQDMLDPVGEFEDYVINKDKSEWNLLVYDKNKLIGMFGMEIRNYGGRYGTLNSIVVDPKYRGKGYALEMMRKAEQELVKAGIKEYRGSTDEKNYAMIKTFKKFGCKRLREMYFYACRPEIALKRFL